MKWGEKKRKGKGKGLGKEEKRRCEEMQDGKRLDGRIEMQIRTKCRRKINA